MKCTNCGNRTQFHKGQYAKKRKPLGLCSNCFSVYKDMVLWRQDNRLSLPGTSGEAIALTHRQEYDGLFE